VFRWRDFTYVYEPGEPMGRNVTYPFVRCLATEETQVGNTYDNIYFNLHDGPLGEGMPRDAVGLTRIFLPGGGEVVPSTASSSAKDGGKETFTVFDETHLYNTPELRRMYVTVDRNCRKRKESTPWALQTSTMYQVNDDSIAERTHGRAELIRDGRSRESGLLFDHREAPADVDTTDREAIIAALREVYGPFADAMDLDGIVDNEFFNVMKDPEDTKRYFFNRRASATDALLTEDDWDPLGDPTIRLDEGETVALFFDGSKSDDSTGLFACRISDGDVFQLGGWEKPEGPAGKDWEVDRVDVDRVVRETREWLDVVAFYADVREFESYVDEWGQLFRDDLVIDATGGKYQHPVAYDMRARVADFTNAATGRFLIDVRDRAFRHEGDPRTRWHVLNMRRSPNKYGVSVSKEGRESPKKIDFGVCIIGCRQARRDVIASGKLEKRKKKRTGKVW
jgi:hypothetical protein